MEILSYLEATESDIPDLVNLLTELFSIEKDFSPDLIKQKIGLELLIKNNETGTIQIAKNSRGKVIGMVTAQLVVSTAQGSASAWIEDMVVESSYRGLGIGKKLLQQTQEWAKRKGATRAQLLVDITNTNALGYYNHLNWESTQLQARRIFL